MNALEQALEASKLLAKHLTADEAEELRTWVRETRPRDTKYEDALMGLALALDQNPQMKHALLAATRKPKEVAQAEQEVLAVVQRHIPRKKPNQEQFKEFCSRVREELCKIFPRASEAGVSGAIAMGIKFPGDRITVEADKMVTTLLHHDPYQTS